MHKAAEDILSDIRIAKQLIDANYKMGLEALKKCKDDKEPDRRSFDGDSGIRLKTDGILDPSGYVYEAVESNRLAGVTVTCYYSEYPDGADAEVWDAADYDQQNPLVTNDFGYYEWYVPEGYWQVKYEKDGYETTYSEWLPVPPPQLDVNIGMKSLSAPEVKGIKVYSDAVVVTFSQYMDVSKITSEQITVKNGENEVVGTVTAQDAQASPDGKLYATTFAFYPDGNVTFSGTPEVTVSGAVNYAGAKMDDDVTEAVAVSVRLTDIVCESDLTVNYGDPIAVSLSLAPAAAAAGKTIGISIDNPGVLESSADKLLTDKDGKAIFTLTAKLPGVAHVTYTVDGEQLSKTVTVTCTNIVAEQLDQVSASVPTGSQVEKGTKVTLYAPADGAEVYYTTDLTCPCHLDNPARTLYTGPIEITGDMNIAAYAVKDGYIDSTPILFTYTVKKVMVGDVDGDGVITILDGTAIQMYLAHLITKDQIDLDAADVSGDGIDILDVTYIQQYLAHIKNAFPVGEMR